MVFRTLIFSACLVGLVSGLTLTAAQKMGVVPIIVAAEAYEVAEAPDRVESEPAHEHPADVTEHHHATDSWAPADGVERTVYTAVSNVLAGVGFAAVLLALISYGQGLGWVQRVSAVRGALWGVAGFTTVFLVPALGLPPEIPGVSAAALEQRQGWWILAVTFTGIGLGIAALAPYRYKLLGLVAMAIPFAVGAPHLDGPEFSHPDAEAVAALTDLHHRFIVASGLSNLVFWLVTGLLCAVLYRRFIQNRDDHRAPAQA